MLNWLSDERMQLVREWVEILKANGQLIGYVGTALWGIWQIRKFRMQQAEQSKQQAEQSRKELKEARREIYQRLELASIELFRFEADHIELIRPLWEAAAKLPDQGTAEDEAFCNYVCQHLNLHEMAIRFRLDNVMEAEVFISWIAWFWKLSTAPRFPQIWTRMKNDYIPVLQDTYNQGVKIASTAGDREAKYKEFKKWVEQQTARLTTP